MLWYKKLQIDIHRSIGIKFCVADISKGQDRYDWDTVHVVVNEGWNMVSYPLYVLYNGKGIYKDSVFHNAVSDLYSYQNGYVRSDTFVLEAGHWVRLAQAETVAIIACPFWPVGTIPVRSGWNMIGTTNIKVLVDTISADPDGIIASAYYDYFQGVGYVETDTIIPGRGYWVKANSAGLIKLQEVPGGGIEPELWPSYFDYPSWHPAGEWIATEHQDSVDEDGDGNYDVIFSGIWLVHAEDGKKQPLIRSARHPDWSPDGSQLVFSSTLDAQLYTVRIISLDSSIVDTSSLRRLTYFGKNFFPSWSPDGNLIAYTLTTPVEYQGIWLIRPDGSNQVKLISGIYPSWSNNGEYIIYLGLWSEIFRVSVTDTSDILRLTSLNQNDRYTTSNSFPKYSPITNNIAFSSQPRGGPTALWLTDSTGSGLQKISPEYARNYDWSPDGTKLVFLYWDYLCPRIGGGHLWIMNIDGSGLRQLTYE